MRPSIYMSVRLFVYLSVFPSVCLSIRLSRRPYVCLSVCLSMCLSFILIGDFKVDIMDLRSYLHCIITSTSWICTDFLFFVPEVFFLHFTDTDNLALLEDIRGGGMKHVIVMTRKKKIKCIEYPNTDLLTFLLKTKAKILHIMLMIQQAT